MFFKNFSEQNGFLVCELSKAVKVISFTPGENSKEIQRFYLKAPSRADQSLIKTCDDAFYKMFKKARDVQMDMQIKAASTLKLLEKNNPTADENDKKRGILEKEIRELEKKPEAQCEYIKELFIDFDQIAPEESINYRKMVFELIKEKMQLSINLSEVEKPQSILDYFDIDSVSEFMPLINEIESEVTIQYTGFFYPYLPSLTNMFLSELKMKKRELRNLSKT